MRKILEPRRLQARDQALLQAEYKKIAEFVKNGSTGEIDITNYKLEELPEFFKTLSGSLDLWDGTILPEGFQAIRSIVYGGKGCKDNCTVSRMISRITPQFPEHRKYIGDNCKFKDLFLPQTEIEHIGKNLRVESLSLSGSVLHVPLPPDLTVTSILNLTKVKFMSGDGYESEADFRQRHPNCSKNCWILLPSEGDLGI